MSDQERERVRVDLVDLGLLDLDLISEIQRLGLNLAIGECWSDTWQLVDAPMKIKWWK